MEILGKIERMVALRANPYASAVHDFSSATTPPDGMISIWLNPPLMHLRELEKYRGWQPKCLVMGTV